MQIVGTILLILSITKLAIAFSSEKSELTRDLYCSIESDFNGFQNKLAGILIIDGLIGLACALILI